MACEVPPHVPPASPLPEADEGRQQQAEPLLTLLAEAGERGGSDDSGSASSDDDAAEAAQECGAPSPDAVDPLSSDQLPSEGSLPGPGAHPFLPTCDEESNSDVSADRDSPYAGHPLGTAELERQQNEVDAQRRVALSDWVQARREEQTAYFNTAAYVRSLVLLNEAQRLDRSDLRRRLCSAAAVGAKPPAAGAGAAAAEGLRSRAAVTDELRRRAAGYEQKWGDIASTVDEAFRAAGPEAVLRGLSTLRLFLAEGQQATSLMPDGHELRRRSRAQEVVSHLAATGELFLPPPPAEASPIAG